MDIPIWFLVLSLILPRITLLIAWFSGSIPPNNIPFWGDFFLAAFLPRILILIYIVGVLGVMSVWFWIHIGFLMLSMIIHTLKLISDQSSQTSST